MDYPRLTEEQLRSNNSEFNALIQNVRRFNSGVADLLMQNRFKLDQHIKAQETELVIIEQFHIAKLRKFDRRKTI